MTTALGGRATVGRPAGRSEQGWGALAALVQDCAAAGALRHVALLRTELLPASLSRPHHHRLTRAALDPLLRADRAIWFDLPGGAVAVCWRGEAAAALAACSAELRHLLAGWVNAPAVAELLRVFSLPGDGDALLQMAQTPAGEQPGAPIADPRQTTFDLTALAVLEQHMGTVDVARFIRTGAVMRRDGAGVMPAWTTRTLHVAELADALMPGCDVAQAPWLFRRLTRALDRRVLALLAAANELAGAQPFSFGLNVESILSPEFLRFDVALPPALRGRVTLGLTPANVATDVPAFSFARDFARVRGYRLALQGMTADTLPLWRLDRLEVDLVSLAWSPALHGVSLARVGLGGADWVLTGADEPAAVQWGAAQGIGLFQGTALAA